jgi:hypothetical protein
MRKILWAAVAEQKRNLNAQVLQQEVELDLD